MTSTAQLRREYPHLIVSPTVPTCTYDRGSGSTWAGTSVVAFYAAGPNYPTGRVHLRVLAEARQAFRAQAAVMLHHGYAFRESAGGTCNCRHIGGTSSTSLHAHGIAKDDNPSKNRYRVDSGLIQFGRQTDMPAAMVRDLEAIRTVDGARALSWGGRWTNVKDPMHWQIDAARRSLATGINLATLPAGAWTRYLTFESGGTLPPTQPESEDTMLPLQYGDGYPVPPDDAKVSGDRQHRSEDVKYIQNLLQRTGRWDGDVDGRYGNDTAAGVALFTSGTNPDGRALTGWNFDNLQAAAFAAAGSTVDQAARDAAQAAQAEAERANKTLDKIRSE